MLRLVRRDPKRPADVIVEPIEPGAPPVTARAIPRPLPDARPCEEKLPSSTDLALDPLDEAIETVHTSELLLEPYEAASLSEPDSERTPITAVSPWQRSAPPPIPPDTEGSA